MKNLLPGDKLLLKLTTIKQGSYASHKSLDLLQEQLPDEAARVLRTTRQLPSTTATALSDYFSSLWGEPDEQVAPPAPEKTEKSIKSDEDLVEEMKALKSDVKLPVARESKDKVHASDFFVDDEEMPMGATFTVNGPDIRI